jgi:CheY-like chemotaxis protein
MTFPTLLISDDAAEAVLTPVLSALGGTVLRCSPAEAVKRLARERFAAVVVNFEDSPLTSHTFPSTPPANASLILRQAQQAIPGHRAVTVALLSDRAKVRNAIAAGANFILYKPISAAQAKATLRAAAAVIKRDRRHTDRVPVQVPVQLNAGDEKMMEGILLDLSCEGLDVLTPQAMVPATAVHIRFGLPGSGIAVDADGEVAWANPNGETGVRFRELTGELRQAMQEWLAKNKPELPALEAEETIEGKLTDLSLGACYVETESPFPEQLGVTLRLRAEDVEAEAEGIVHVMHPGFGMGIEFARKTVEDSAQVANFIGFLKACPGTTPQLSVKPRDLVPALPPATDDEQLLFFVEMDDPLLDLLHHHERLSQEQFLQELCDQRSGAAVSAS